jgi:hypothetical protein
VIAVSEPHFSRLPGRPSRVRANPHLARHIATTQTRPAIPTRIRQYVRNTSYSLTYFMGRYRYGCQRVAVQVLRRQTDHLIFRIVMVTRVANFHAHLLEIKRIQQSARCLSAGIRVAIRRLAVTLHDLPNPQPGAENCGNQQNDKYDYMHANLCPCSSIIQRNDDL